MYKLKDPLITQKVMLDRFVDDIETGDDKEEVVEEIKVNVNPNTYKRDRLCHRTWGCAVYA